jgi:hypothetical protein
MKTCDKCKGEIFRVELKVFGILFTCVICGHDDAYYFEDYDGLMFQRFFLTFKKEWFIIK